MSEQASENQQDQTDQESQTDEDRQQDQQEQERQYDHKYVDRLRRESQRYRNEAKTNAAAAKRLAELEDSQKTEAQRSADRVARLESDLANERSATLRFKIASEFKIDSDDAELFLTASDEETLRKQAERLQARDSGNRQQIPSPTRSWGSGEGRSPDQQGDPDLAFASDLFGGGS